LADESFMRFGLAFLSSAVLCMATVSCESPWEQPTDAMTARESTTYEVYADAASLGKWIDKRPRSQITHGMLVIDHPKSAQSYFVPNSTVVITTTSDVIADKSAAIARGDYRLPKGTKTNYAIGGTVDVRIERIIEDGKRVLVGENRVSFLEIVQP